MNHEFPPLWFRLPPGFYDIAAAQRAEFESVAEATGNALAEQQVAQLLDHLDELAEHHVVHTAIGLHPDGPSGLSTSLFSLTVRRVETNNPRLAVARTALALAKSPLWITSTRRFIDLPSSLPCCLVAGTLALPGIQHSVFQARAALAHSEGPYVVVLDLSSVSSEHDEAYSDVLEGIVHTVSFTDPTPPEVRPSRILEVLL
ncbi:hypothetical protein [Streptomyces sp. NPDC051211]|uniref:hypothetical protein n=1 Tax=Streptomyces sp. NPDC051211 TaxID=3154643 RepID=UPI00344DA548